MHKLMIVCNDILSAKSSLKDSWLLPEAGAFVNLLYPQPCITDINRKQRQYVATHT